MCDVVATSSSGECSRIFVYHVCPRRHDGSTRRKVSGMSRVRGDVGGNWNSGGAALGVASSGAIAVGTYVKFYSSERERATDDLDVAASFLIDSHGVFLSECQSFMDDREIWRRKRVCLRGKEETKERLESAVWQVYSGIMAAL